MELGWIGNKRSILHISGALQASGADRLQTAPSPPPDRASAIAHYRYQARAARPTRRSAQTHDAPREIGAEPGARFLKDA